MWVWLQPSPGESGPLSGQLGEEGGGLGLGGGDGRGELSVCVSRGSCERKCLDYAISFLLYTRYWQCKFPEDFKVSMFSFSECDVMVDV